MYLIKGYKVHNSATTLLLKIVMFSSFSNLVCDNEKTLNEFRERLEKEQSEETGQDVTIVFTMFDIPNQSKDSKIMREFLNGKTTKQISGILNIDENLAESLINKYLKGNKI